jgi:cytochrome P450 family 135
VLRRLHEEIDAGESEVYLIATIQETLRRRPVLPQAEPRLVAKPIEIGGWRYEPGVVLAGSAWLVHHDPDVYPDPFAFRPERSSTSRRAPTHGSRSGAVSAAAWERASRCWR